MQQIKTHFYTDDGVACKQLQRPYNPLRFSTHPQEVTCGRCKVIMFTLKHKSDTYSPHTANTSPDQTDPQ